MQRKPGKGGDGPRGAGDSRIRFVPFITLFFAFGFSCSALRMTVDPCVVRSTAAGCAERDCCALRCCPVLLSCLAAHAIMLSCSSVLNRLVLGGSTSSIPTVRRDTVRYSHLTFVRAASSSEQSKASTGTSEYGATISYEPYSYSYCNNKLARDGTVAVRNPYRTSTDDAVPGDSSSLGADLIVVCCRRCRRRSLSSKKIAFLSCFCASEVFRSTCRVTIEDVQTLRVVDVNHLATSRRERGARVRTELGSKKPYGIHTCICPSFRFPPRPAG